jgi:cytochrome c
MRRLLLSSLLMLAACGQAPQDQSSAQAPAPVAAPAPTAEEMQTRIAALPAPFNQASYEDGRRVFAQCRSCHTTAEGAGNRVGPNLHGVIGRRIGTAPGFTYSQPVASAGFTWDAEHLDKWIENPAADIPGTRMAFAGVRDPDQRRDVIAYLMVETADHHDGDHDNGDDDDHGDD